MISTLAKGGVFMHALSAAHRVLYNMDILHNIIDIMYNIFTNSTPVQLRSDRRDAARLARVCKSFLEPALDRLWEWPENLQPVHLLWNASVFSCNSPDDKEQSLHRLYYYTKRMKYVRYTEREGTECDLLKIHRLHRLCKGRPLFPSIHTLHLCVWPLSASELDLLLHPSLRHVSISYFPNCPSRTVPFTKLARVQQEQMCLHLLVKRCPELREITDYQVTARIQGVLFDLKRLSTISPIVQLPTTPSRRDKWLEKMSVLKHLTSLGFSTKGYPDDAISQLDLGPFSCLESLSINGSVSMLSSIFGAMRNQLKNVSITTDIVEGWRMEQCMQLLVCNSDKMLSCFTLSPLDLVLNYRLGHDPLDFPSIPQWSMLQPLTQLRNLEHVNVYAPCVVTYHDIIAFASSWPYLRSLRIYHHRSPAIDRGFDALIGLVQKCPRLESIELILNLDDLPPREEILDVCYSVKYMNLYYLIVGNDDHARNIARSILRLFPRMYTATSGTLMYELNALEEWDRVKEIISRLRAVEEEEEDKEDEDVFSNRSPDSEQMSDV